MSTDDSFSVPLADVPTVRLPIALYRAALRITRRHGLFTIARAHVRMFPRGQIVVLPTGARLFVPPDAHLFGFVLGTHEPHITELCRRFIQPGDMCIDVGANIGYFSAIMARLAGHSGRVFAFEPVPENFYVLQLNAELASTQGAKIIPMNVAVSEKPGTLQIVRSAYSTGHQVCSCTTVGDNPESITAVSLDRELPNLTGNRRVSFAKIDVEGHELSLLRGLAQSLAAGRLERLVIEVTPSADVAKIDEILSKYARRVECWVKGGWRKQRITSLTERTDVFVDCTAR